MHAPGVSVAGARAVVIVALAAHGPLAGCGAPSHRLPPAGSIDDRTGGADDGAGQLAQASVQIRLGDGLDEPAAGSDSRDTRRYYFRERRDEAWFSGSVYGLDASMGGGYGGFAVATPFGVLDGAAPPPYDRGDAALVGQVTWRAGRGVPWPAGCEGRVARAGAPAAGVVVYLAQANRRTDEDDDGRWSTTRGAVVADRCGLWPAAQSVGPVPAVIDVENAGPSSLVLGRGTSGGELTLEPGARWSFGVAEPALVRLDADDRAPAWILGQLHDFHTVTDDLGRFALDGVPAGTYELVVWSPPLVRALDGERPQWTEPTTAVQRVTVGATGTARVTVALDPAP